MSAVGAQTLSPSSDDQALIERLRTMMSQRDAGGVQRRDVHCKMHGLMRAEFTVRDDVPIELRHGLFARPGTFKAWVRCSNASNTIKPDSARDIRGMGIKLMGVPGPKLLQAEADATTQDMILISAPIFPTRTAAAFDALVAAVIGSLWDKLLYFPTHPWVSWILATTMVHHADVLRIPYFSSVPYALGPYVVKYVVLPQDAQDETPPALPDDSCDNFLRKRAAARLAQGPVSFDFAVQVQRDEACMPLDDPRRTWSLKLSPPRKLATLRVLQQTFDTETIDRYGEGLRYTPWHSLPEHRPLGGINESRKIIYETLSAFRREANHFSAPEPSDWDV